MFDGFVSKMEDQSGYLTHLTVFWGSVLTIKNRLFLIDKSSFDELLKKRWVCCAVNV